MTNLARVQKSDGDADDDGLRCQSPQDRTTAILTTPSLLQLAPDGQLVGDQWR